ncbi:ABC transporter permease [Acidicapsa acidisoli]|uniref:ABC transporter permease n=1 Tax=Acidicapsa acidisoli TaxID=1615681 RepID=UPI0021E0733E|nr:ABC transporter permease [Acidicapsa acidisoli]
MGQAGGFFRKLRILIRRDQFRSELDEEMTFHRMQAEKEFLAGGMTRKAARLTAMRQFGNGERLKERSREVVGFRIETVLQDLRFALRQLRKNPGFTATAVVVLALGIGASVAIFGFVDAALIKPLPYRDPSRIVGVYESAKQCPKCNLSYEDYLDWKKQNAVFQSLEAWGTNSYLFPTPSGAQPVPGTRVSDGFFRALGVTPFLGRDFYTGESSPEAPRTVLLSYAAWQERFGGQKSAVGQTITLSGLPYTIIGVLPREFNFAPRGISEFWSTFHDPNGCEKRRSCHSIYGLARLKDGVTTETATADTKTIAQRLEMQYPNSNKGQGAIVLPLSEVIVGNIRPILLVLLAGATLLLLIACVNVSSLVLVRAETRKREFAVRSALGASRMRLMRQFATEGIVLVTVGTALSLGAADAGMRALSALPPKQALGSMPFLEGLKLNMHSIAFAGLLAVVAAILFSIVPMLRLPLALVYSGLTEGGRNSAGRAWRSLGANLVVAEMATAMVLLAGAGLLAKSFYRLLHVDVHFNPDHLALVNVEAPDEVYGKAPQSLTLDRKVVARVSQLPGVISVGLSSDPPLTCNCDTTWFRVMGHGYNGEHNDAPERDVTPEYFKTLQAGMVRGRAFTESDDAGHLPYLIINKTLAQQFFPGEDPVGKKIGDPLLSKESLREIIGVVDDIREGALDDELRPAVYYPMYQEPEDGFTVVVRAAQSPESVLSAISAAIHQIDPGIGVSNETTMTEQIDNSATAAIHRAAASLVGGFAAMALVLGVVGLYGVVAYSVSQRTREIGVRMALGAPRRSVYGLILREAGWLTGIGIVLGLACSIGAATGMRKLLFGTEAWDATTLVSVAMVLAAAAMFASYIPAHRAAGVDPAEALRAE